MLPVPALLQMQLLQQQMLHNGGGYMDGFDDELYDMYDPSHLLQLYWMEGYGHGNAHGQINGFEQAQYYQMLQQIQQMQMAHRMQMMGYGGHHGHGMRFPRRRSLNGFKRMRMMGGLGGSFGMRGMVGGEYGGGRALMGSPFGMDAMRGNQLALMSSPWGGG